MLTRTANRWNASANFSSVCWEVLRIVTAFTLAHSITLRVATLGLVTVPSRVVEPAIAVSMLNARLSNLCPQLVGRRWVVAFVFGLFHGFGFARVLADLGCDPFCSNRVWLASRHLTRFKSRPYIGQIL